MWKPGLIVLIVFAAAILAWPAELAAFGGAVHDDVLGSYVVKFVDAATWVASCF